MSGRPRTSTLVISGLFVAVLALYILFRPVSAAQKAEISRSSGQQSPTPTASPSPTQTRPSPSRSPSRSPSATPSVTPSGSGTPTTSPSPSGSQATAPPVLNPLPTTTGSPTP